MDIHHINPVTEIVTVSETSIFIWMVAWKDLTAILYSVLFLLSSCDLQLIQYDKMVEIKFSDLFSILLFMNDSQKQQ